MATLRKVLQGEKVERWVKVPERPGLSETVPEGQVIRQHVTEHNKLGDVLVEWTFDFAGVSRKDLMVLASRSVLIGVRPRFRGTSVEEAEKGWGRRTISVLGYLANNREKLAPAEKARRALSNLSEEEMREIAREHGMEYKPKKVAEKK